MIRHIARSTASPVSISAEKMGPPGVVGHLYVVPIFENETRSNEERLRDNTLRNFCVTARLAKNYDVQPSIDINFNEDSGDSLFRVPDKIAHMRVDTLDSRFFFFQNSEKRLSTVRFECTAHSSDEARQLFQRIIGPALDHLAYIAHSPLHIVQVTIVDELNHISSTDILSPYPVVTISPGVGKVRDTLGPVYAMYREATNSTSPFYRFFCLHKILEGLLKKLRGKLYEEAKQKRIALPPLEAKVPDYPDIPDEQKPYVGKSIARFFDEFLTARFRNPMAHFIDDEGAVLNVNQMEGIEQYWTVVHVADLCCREVISHFETCLDILEQRSVNRKTDRSE